MRSTGGLSNGPEKPPFDIVRASFYLVAGVFAVYAAVILIAISTCAWHSQEILNAAEKGQLVLECAKDGRLMEGLGTLLASALAFAAGRMQPPKGDK